MNDGYLIESKLESLRRCLARVETKRPPSLEELESDYDLQDILTVNLERAVQICVDITGHIVSTHEQVPPETMGESFDTLHSLGILSADLSSRMKKAVGFRNVAVHAYRSLNWAIVHDISHNRLHDFQEFAQSVVREMDAARGN